MFRFALFNLLSRKARSALALLGLTVAIVGMVGLFSVIEGLERLSKESFARIPGIIVLQTGSPVPLFSRLPAEWEEDLKQVEGVKVVSPEIWFRANVIEGKMITSRPRVLFGVDIPTWNALESALYRDDIVEGRFLTASDVGTENAVISRPIQEEFDLKLGDRFTVNGDDATLVGVYETGSILIDLTIVMDRHLVQKRTRFDENSVSAFYLETTDGDNEAAIKRIQDAFRGRSGEPWKSSLSLATDENPIQTMLNGLDRMLKSQSKKKPSPPETQTGEQSSPPPEASPPSRKKQNIDPRFQVDENMPIDVQSAEEWSERFNQFTENLDYIMLILASIGVTIAVLGIANTMLMSVSERIIEIGILKANGWSRKHVLSLIAYESSILGFLGGCLGSLVGWCGTLFVNANFGEHVSLYAGPALLSFSIAFATVLGLLAGLYPAVWAMRLMPMDAIRRG